MLRGHEPEGQQAGGNELVSDAAHRDKRAVGRRNVNSVSDSRIEAGSYETQNSENSNSWFPAQPWPHPASFPRRVTQRVLGEVVLGDRREVIATRPREFLLRLQIFEHRSDAGFPALT